MADFATYQDVEGLWRPLTADEQTVATNLLRFASAIIRSKFPAIDDRIAAGDLDGDLATVVAAEMVKRRLQNPSGLRSESVDDYSFTRDQEHSAGGLYLTDDEVTLLSGRRVRSFSITPATPSPTEADLALIAEHRAGWGR